MILENLKQNARALAGLTLQEVAQQLSVELKQQKGWIGQLIEQALQATAGSKPVPDFPELGIELKTIPVNRQGRPQESTFVCTVNLEQLTGLTWENSWLKQKLAHVLWVPIEADKTIAFAQRRIGLPFFWQPSAEELLQLKTDWLELTELLQCGEIDAVSALSGQVLQIRPKGADAQALTKHYNIDGEPSQTLPRGFYLRSNFTQKILAKSKDSTDNKARD